MDATTGDAQFALAGTALTQPLAVTVRDSKGTAVPNVTVTFAVTAGGGTVAPSTVVSNASGLAGGVTWTLGTHGGQQTVLASAGTLTKTFTATILSSFPLDLRFFGPPMSAPAALAFTNAANRLRAAIISPVSTVTLQGTDISGCGIPGLTGILNESTQGVIIYAGVTAIDGAGKILARAGPCFVRFTSRLPIIGVMQFDEADIQNYINTGRFEAVVLHEMNHVLGFGTIWGPLPDKNLLSNPAFDSLDVATGSTNPRFTGAVAIANCLGLGGTAGHCAVGTGVAVEMCGGLGTADGHWRESFTSNCAGSNNAPVGGTAAFDTELMTGYVESSSNMPWSTMTIGSFQDLGYTVNLLAADTYAAPNLLAMARMSLQAEAATDGPRELVHRAKFEISSSGRVTIINREKK